MKRTLILILFIVKTLAGQDKAYIDSLKKVATSKNDSIRFSAYSELNWVLKDTDKDEAMHYAEMLIKEATKLNDQKWLAQGYNDVGIVHIRNGNMQKALEYNIKALNIRKRLGNKKDIASSLSKIGNIYVESLRYNDALATYLETLTIYEDLKIEPYIAYICNNISQVYINLNNFELSNAYIKRAYTINKKNNDISGIGVSLAILSSNFDALKQYDSSLFYCLKSLPYLKESGNYNEYAIVLNNLGLLYRKLKQPVKGTAYYKQAIEIAKQNSDSSGLALYQSNYANTLIELGKLNEAEPLLMNALMISEKLKLDQNIFKIYRPLIELNVKKGDHEKANEYFAKYNAYIEREFSKEHAKQLSEAQTKFDVERKNLELQRSKAEVESQQKQNFIKNIIIVAIIIITILIGLVIYIAYNNYKKQQALKLEAELAKQQVEHDRKLNEAEEKERRRISQDLHDNMGAYTTSILAQIDALTLSQKEGLNDTKLVSLRNDAENIMSTLRETIWILKTKAISLSNFSELIKNYAVKNLSKNLGIDLHFTEEILNNKNLSPAVTLNLYRIIQEVLQNIIKHANASKVDVFFSCNDKISLTISDNGKGFEKDVAIRNSGLDNIEYRAKEINFSVIFSAKIGGGTSIQLQEN